MIKIPKVFYLIQQWNHCHLWHSFAQKTLILQTLIQ